MNSPIDFIWKFFWYLAYRLQTLLCLVAVVIVLVKRRQLSSAFLWALSGFGLATFLQLLYPLVWNYFVRWRSSNATHHLVNYYNMCLSITGSILSAAIYGLLLIAVCAGRSQTSELMPQAGKE